MERNKGFVAVVAQMVLLSNNVGSKVNDFLARVFVFLDVDCLGSQEDNLEFVRNFLP